jgi:geranylgeranyl diphosphate synthase, type I
MTWESRPAELLQDETESILFSLKDVPGLLVIIKESRAVKNQAGNETSGSLIWSLLPLMVCESICGEYDRVIPAAASLQLLHAAAEIFDDLEDQDSSTSLTARYGPAIAINTASALLILAEKALPRLKLKGVSNDIIVRTMDIISTAYAIACSGQHQDLSLPAQEIISEERYLQIAYLKSASTFECSCRVGALIAGASDELIDNFAKFGYNLGMMAQVANDIKGVTSLRDISHRKATLPAIYALANLEGEARQQMESAFLRYSEAAPEPVKTKELLFSCGAVYYAAIKMELYRQTAQEIFNNIGPELFTVEHLKEYLK